MRSTRAPPNASSDGVRSGTSTRRWRYRRVAPRARGGRGHARGQPRADRRTVRQTANWTNHDGIAPGLATVSPLTFAATVPNACCARSSRACAAACWRACAGVCGRAACSLDESDLEACYAQAWQGLYSGVLEGQEIANPAGWLALVTYRRAIDEHRARAAPGASASPARRGTAQARTAARREPRLPARRRARRSRPAAPAVRGAARAAQRARARGRGALLPAGPLARRGRGADGCERGAHAQADGGSRRGRPGVARKVGELVETIRAGGWCEEQGSLMRALRLRHPRPRRASATGSRSRTAVNARPAAPTSSRCAGLAAVLPPVLSPLALTAGASAAPGRAPRSGGALAAARAAEPVRRRRGIGGGRSEGRGRGNARRRRVSAGGAAGPAAAGWCSAAARREARRGVPAGAGRRCGLRRARGARRPRRPARRDARSARARQLAAARLAPPDAATGAAARLAAARRGRPGAASAASAERPGVRDRVEPGGREFGPEQRPPPRGCPAPPVPRCPVPLAA